MYGEPPDYESRGRSSASIVTNGLLSFSSSRSLLLNGNHQICVVADSKVLTSMHGYDAKLETLKTVARLWFKACVMLCDRLLCCSMHGYRSSVQGSSEDERRHLLARP